uniref:Uncharacterized protein n=1 Tax=Chenopodium quinoa TaxID=63459 RepID=A0A803MSN1_CHEQI
MNQKNEDGNTPVHVAAEVGDMDIFKLLHNYVYEETVEEEGSAFITKNGEGNIPLHVALIHGNVEVAKLLVENHPKMVNVINNYKETLLHLATMHQPIDVPIEKRKVANTPYLDMIKLLLEKDRLILDHCPHSAELRDGSSKTILHLLKTIPSYKEGKDLLDVKEIFGLRNHQDKEGNTPLHMAAKNLNFYMVRVLLDSSAKQSIRNKDGISAASLIQEQFEQTLEKNQMTLEVCEAIDRANMSFLREKLHNFGNNYLFSRDSKRRNVLHKLMQISNGTPVIPNDFVDFIEEVLESFPTFIGQVDINGDTPLHILMRNSPNTLIRYVSVWSDYCVLSLSELKFVLRLLELCYTYFERYKEEARSKGAHYDRPWLVQNSKGNTPLHEALLIKNQDPEVVVKLLEFDINIVARLTNNLNETPLHLAAEIFNYSGEDVDSVIIDDLAKAYEDAAYTHDKNGLTPLLRAAQSGNVITISRLLMYFSDSVMTSDEKHGQTMLHLLIQHQPYCIKYLYKAHGNSKFEKQIFFQNYEGDTPLHLAIKGGRFFHAKHFLQGMETGTISKLLESKNNAGVTPSDLLGSSQKIPVQ